jgi:hypothetical protein
VVRELIDTVRVETQSFRATSNQPRLGRGVAAGEQSDIVAEFDKLFGEVRYDAFGSTIKLGRNALI